MARPLKKRSLFGTKLTPEQALDRLEELYEQSVNALREAIADYVDNGTLPDPHA
ncbi:hypothetical protein ONQ60_28120, partial [Salmonella enterica subsp. enterica serovar Virginia]|nr:hypothetical protein [Salmonella enterica subsp. enterica serovar Virginia]